MNPLIGIVASELIDFPWAPIHHGQRSTYVNSIDQAGGVPVIVPLIHDTAKLRRLYNRLDGLLLAGGGDIDPSSYDEQPTVQLDRLSPERDRVELQMLEWALADRKPVLAICRGMQLLNVLQGGKLYQDVSLERPSDIDHYASRGAEDYSHIVHGIEISAGTQLAKITGKRSIRVNSLHHQAIKDLGQGLVVSAVAPDGIIEGVELEGMYAVAVQFHPESLQRNAACRRLFSSFVEASSAQLDTSPAMMPELA